MKICCNESNERHQSKKKKEIIKVIFMAERRIERCIKNTHTQNRMKMKTMKVVKKMV